MAGILYAFLAKLQSWKRVLLVIVVFYTIVVILYEYHYEDVKTPLQGAKATSVVVAESNKLIKIILEYRNMTSLTFNSQTLLPRMRNGNVGQIRIAIGLGITSRGMKKVTEENLDHKFLFFKILLPSFCKTLSRGYSYFFYLAFDHSDQILSKDSIQQAFNDTFVNITSESCPLDDVTTVHLQFVRCSHQRKPSWAQNDAMLEAYLDGMEYFYRINDDTIMTSGNWTEIMIHALGEMKPPNVGVVGPRQRGKRILTYDFVHRTHVDIFGFYYPRFFTDWWADQWVTVVYRPHNSKILTSVQLRHTMQMGQRYVVDRSKRGHVNKQIIADKITFQSYLKQRLFPISNNTHNNMSKVIAISLLRGGDMWDAIRNAQIARVFYSDWKLRFYVKAEHCNATTLIIPNNIQASLQDLEADLISVDNCGVPEDRVSWLAMQDVAIDVLLLPDSLLTTTDVDPIASWLQDSEYKCFSLFNSNSSKSVGAFALKLNSVRPILGIPLQTILENGNAIVARSGRHGDVYDVLKELLLPFTLHQF